MTQSSTGKTIETGKTYCAPRLVRYGTVDELTGGGPIREDPNSVDDLSRP